MYFFKFISDRYTSAIRALTSDLRKGAGSPSNTAAKEAEKRRIAPRTGVSRIPASRSSSSGSSVGPALRNIRKSVGVSYKFYFIINYYYSL